MECETLQNKKSDAYAIVALAFALVDSISILSGLGLYHVSAVHDLMSALQQIVAMISIPVMFGIIGLKSSARKSAITAIVLAVLNVLILIALVFVGFYSRYN